MDWSGDMADKIGTGECGEILIYQTDNGQTNIEVKIEDDTVWLTQQQMSELFQTSRTNVVEHIKHIYEEFALSPHGFLLFEPVGNSDRLKLPLIHPPHKYA